MGETIFRVLKTLEGTALAPDASGILGGLVSFIESGVCSGSKVDKFIMQHFRLSPTELTRLWNKRYSQNKSANTFRGQISLLSSYICSILGHTALKINDAFVVADMEILMGISDIIGVFPYGSMDLSDAFLGHELLPVPSLDCHYPISSCWKELSLLQSLDRRIIQTKIAGADAGKLSYVLGVLSQPLVTDAYSKMKGKKKKRKLARVNRDKLQFLKALPHLPPPASEIPEKHQRHSSPPTTAVTADTVPPTPYSLSLSGQLMGILQSAVKKYEALPEDKKRAIMAISNVQSRKRAEKFLSLFTEDVFRRYIESLNAYDLCMALGKYKV